METQKQARHNNPNLTYKHTTEHTHTDVTSQFWGTTDLHTQTHNQSHSNLHRGWDWMRHKGHAWSVIGCKHRGHVLILLLTKTGFKVDCVLQSPLFGVGITLPRGYRWTRAEHGKSRSDVCEEDGRPAENVTLRSVTQPNYGRVWNFQQAPAPLHDGGILPVTASKTHTLCTMWM